MGYRISWLAAKGIAKADFLDHFELCDTGAKDEANETPFSVAELPTGWTVLWSNDPTFAKIEICARLSLKAPVLSCWVNETVMSSSVNYFEYGSHLWFLGHDAEQGIHNLVSDGELPTQFASIRHRLFEQQDAEGGEQADVDYIFDVPLELAQSICGFKHDLWRFEWGTPDFSAVETKTAEPLIPNVEAKSGWLSRIFSRH